MYKNRRHPSLVSDIVQLQFILDATVRFCDQHQREGASSSSPIDCFVVVSG